MTILVADTATEIDFEVHQGETWIVDFEIVDRNGAPFPTAGCTVTAVAKMPPPAGSTEPGAVIATLTGAAAVGTPTSVRVSATAAQTAAWTWRSAVYDVKVVDASVPPNTGYPAKGRITVIAADTV